MTARVIPFCRGGAAPAVSPNATFEDFAASRSRMVLDWHAWIKRGRPSAADVASEIEATTTILRSLWQLETSDGD